MQRATCNSLDACGRHFGTLFNLFEVFSVCGNLFWFVSPFTSGLICVAVFQLGFHRFDRLFFTRAPTGKEQITVMFKIIKNIVYYNKLFKSFFYKKKWEINMNIFKFAGRRVACVIF